MKLFEYIFYRTAKYYYKRDGSSAFSAVGTLSLIYLMIFLDLLIIFLEFVPVETKKYVKDGRMMGVLLFTCMFIINYFYFKGKYWKLSDRWRGKETPTQQTVRGWLVVLAIFAPMIMYVLLFIIF